MATNTRKLADLLANIDNNSKITTGGLLDATITAADLAPNSVDSSELVDGSIDTSHIGDLQVTAGKVAADAVTTAKVADNAVTGVKIAADTIPVKPHIQPGTLYPAWSGLLDNHTAYTFTDSGNTGHTITPAGNIYHSGATEKIGSTSINFDGTGDYLSVADHADFDISGQFTIECWVNFRTKTNYDGIITFDGTGSADFVLAYYDTRLHLFSHAGNGTSVVNSSDTINLNQWYHVAISRDGSNNTRFYLDGVHKAVSTSYTAGHTTTSGGVKVGRYYAADDEKYFDGFLDELRVSNTARYTGTSSFTPSTSAFSSDANTKLLIHSDNGGNVGAYGTEQSDGKKYYYTDIKGSKPIKDPRIGAHFGSQRHKTKSYQLLEQETGEHGLPVYSVDGRESIRAYGKAKVQNSDHGQNIQLGNDGAAGLGYCEIVGYFTAVNLLTFIYSNNQYCGYEYKIDGGPWSAEQTTFNTTVNSPLGDRYVDRTSMATIVSGQTLGIHTLSLKIPDSGDTLDIYGCELIAQDTGSTARRNHVNIPAQNVVSYGKKFSIGSDTLTNAVHKHYNPFAFKTDGTTAWASGAHNGTSWPVGTGSSHNIDTATSLGLENWKHSNNYYKPYNGGRVVRWVASDGTIKTSVTVMPPNAQNLVGSAISAKANASVANDTYLPTFTGTIDNSLSEVAKTFHWREFGNGGANGGEGHNYYADFSRLGTTQDVIAYCMDDGLTSAVGDNMAVQNMSTNGGLRINVNGSTTYWTFIGTGISQYRYRDNSTVEEKVTWAQNLSYGSHVVTLTRDGSANQVVKLDGVTLETNSTTAKYLIFGGPTIHQPKMPPIPEDAVVIADYMLMADYVKQTTGASGYISKGVRRNAVTRDFFLDASAGNWGSPNVKMDPAFSFGFSIYNNGNQSADVMFAQLPCFATRIDSLGYADRRQIYVDSGTAEAQTVYGSTYDTVATMNTAKDLGLYTFKAKNKATTNGNYTGFDIAIPIHTSSHYQTFETPFLRELVGGDRNMEQTNLVVTADGKSWDEVTRDTSYISNMRFQASSDGTDMDSTQVFLPDNVRARQGTRDLGNKDFIMAHDRLICLVDGVYCVGIRGYSNQIVSTEIKINGTLALQHNLGAGSGGSPYSPEVTVHLKRGDYIQWNSPYSGGHYGDWWVWKV